MTTQILGPLDVTVGRLPYTLPATYNNARFNLPPRIRPTSFLPYLTGNMGTDGAGAPSVVAEVLARLTGLSQNLLNPTGIDATNTTTFSAADVSTMLNVANTPLYVAPFSRAVGTHAFAPASTPAFVPGDTSFGQYSFEAIRENNSLSNAACTFYRLASDASPPLPARVLSNFYMTRSSNAGVSFTNAFNCAPYTTIGVSAGFFQGVSHFANMHRNGRNYSFVGKSSSGIHGPLSFSWDNDDRYTPGNQGVLNTVTFDAVSFSNAAIQTAFDTEAYEVYSWFGGFIFVFYTNGAGPTGQPNEIVLMSNDWTSGYLLRLFPGDAGSVIFRQFSGNPQWSAKLDTDGSLYLTSALNLDNFIYVAAMPGPIVQPTNQNPIALPCYYACVPPTCPAPQISR